MQRYIPTVIGLCVIVLGGYLHGRMTNRWTSSTAVEDAAAKLQNVPATIGDWHSTGDIEIPQRALKIAEFAGHVSRTYVHRPSGASVNLLIGCGAKGPISVHPPDVCFPGAGFYPLSPKRRFAVKRDESGAPDNFWIDDFGKSSAAGEGYVRVFWSWSAAGRWLAADQPRVTFAPHPFLYKMYVTRAMNRFGEPLDNDACVEFLQSLLPILQQVLFDLPSGQPSPPTTL